MVQLPKYSVKDIERKASQLLTARYGHDIPVPVDVELLVEEMDGVSLDIYPALRANHKIEGMVFRDVESGKLMVLIDEDLADGPPNRYRMTVAEELAHLHLHGSVIEQVREIQHFREIQRHSDWQEAERNAKRFAAAILMPGKNVGFEAAELYSKLITVAGFNDTNAVKSTMASVLAKKFEVSSQSMKYRLTEWPMRVYDRVENAMRDRLDYLESGDL